MLAYLLKYDSSHGTYHFSESIRASKEHLAVNNKYIQNFQY